MKKLMINFLKKFGLRSFVKSIIRSFNYKTKIKINDTKFKSLRLYGAECKVTESWILEILKIIFNIKQGAFLDVGVNLGQTLIEVKSIDPNKAYVGFEPNPACVFYVEELIRINKIRNTQIIPVGLFKSDSILSLDLYDDEITNSGGSVIKNFWEYKNWQVQRTLLVPVYSFLTIKESIKMPNFDIIKIDVEGAELEVLQTLSEEIVKNKPIILIEILSAYSEKNHLRFERQQHLLKLIKKLEYRIIRINESDEEQLVNVEKIDYFDVNSNPNNCNYILFHINDEISTTKHFDSYFKAQT
jgi:FkbM family methyltransferase